MYNLDAFEVPGPAILATTLSCSRATSIEPYIVLSDVRRSTIPMLSKSAGSNVEDVGQLAVRESTAMMPNMDRSVRSRRSRERSRGMQADSAKDVAQRI